jgi:hypothetical protein
MDERLFKSKHFDIYFSTLQIGVGLSYVPEHKTLHLHLILFEFCIYFGGLDRWE